MGAYKNDQVTMTNVKPQDKIGFLIKEVEKLKKEISELKNKLQNEINNR